MMTRAEKALLKSKRRKALRAKRKADTEVLDIPAEEENEKRSRPGISRGPKKINPKDLLSALAELPAAALGGIVAGSLVAGIAAGGIALDSQIDAGDDRVALQEVKDRANLLPEDTVDILNEARGLRPEVKALQDQMANMQEQVLDFEDQINKLKLNSVTQDEISSLNSTIGDLSTIIEGNSNDINSNDGVVSGLIDDFGPIRVTVNRISEDVVVAQRTAVNAAESATEASAEAERATVAAGVAEAAAIEAQIAADAVAVELAEAKALAIKLANDTTVAQSAADQALADVAVAQATANQATVNAIVTKAIANQATADAIAAAEVADEGLGSAELALKKLPIVSTANRDRTNTGSPMNLGSAGPKVDGIYSVEGSVWYTAGCGTLTLKSLGYDILTDPGVQTIRDGNIVTFRGTLAMQAGSVAWQFIGNGCRFKSTIVSFSFIE